MPEPTTVFIITAALIAGVSSAASFAVGWVRGRSDLRHEQFRLARDHRVKHEREHGQ